MWGETRAREMRKKMKREQNWKDKCGERGSEGIRRNPMRNRTDPVWVKLDGVGWYERSGGMPQNNWFTDWIFFSAAQFITYAHIVQNISNLNRKYIWNLLWKGEKSLVRSFVYTQTDLYWVCYWRIIPGHTAAKLNYRGSGLAWLDSGHQNQGCSKTADIFRWRMVCGQKVNLKLFTAAAVLCFNEFCG